MRTGESIAFVVAHNGGTKVFEKVETPAAIVEQRLPVDRGYYLKALRVPMDNIFLPIVRQRLARAASVAAATKKQQMRLEKETEERAVAEVKRLLWRVIANKQLQEDAAKKRACIEASPIARAFACARKQAAAPPGL